jgi:hypothetical protein
LNDLIGFLIENIQEPLKLKGGCLEETLIICFWHYTSAASGKRGKENVVEIDDSDDDEGEPKKKKKKKAASLSLIKLTLSNHFADSSQNSSCKCQPRYEHTSTA